MAAAKKKSGPSGENLVPQRSIRVPDELWEAFAVATGGKRNAVLIELIQQFVERKRVGS